MSKLADLQTRRLADPSSLEEVMLRQNETCSLARGMLADLQTEETLPQFIKNSTQQPAQRRLHPTEPAQANGSGGVSDSLHRDDRSLRS